MSPIRVLLVDDHDLVRAGIRSLLAEMPGVEVVAEAADGRLALDLVENLAPTIVLMDVMMPGMNGLDATARVTARHPGSRVIILSMNESEEYVLQALRAGAAGYVLKNVKPAELEQAIRAVAAGQSFLTSAVSQHVIAGYLQQSNPGANPLDRLTPRQREVLQLVAEGKSTKQIARLLGISVKTADGHRTQLMQALDIHDVAGLVRFAIRTGVITVKE